MRASELKDLTVAELERKLQESTEEQFRLGFRSASESIENPMRFRTLRKDIARIHTVLRQKRGGQS